MKITHQHPLEHKKPTQAHPLKQKKKTCSWKRFVSAELKEQQRPSKVVAVAGSGATLLICVLYLGRWLFQWAWDAESHSTV